MYLREIATVLSHAENGQNLPERLKLGMTKMAAEVLHMIIFDAITTDNLPFAPRVLHQAFGDSLQKTPLRRQNIRVIEISHLR